MLIPADPEPRSLPERYLDLMKRVLTRAAMARTLERQSLRVRNPVQRLALAVAHALLMPLSLEIVRVIHCTPQDYLESGDLASNRVEDAETMLGMRQLDNMQACVADVIRDGVPGDLAEAGVWRGGMTIFMRAALSAHGDTTRTVWVLDSFAGLPEPDDTWETFGWRERDMAVGLPEVQQNFARFGLLDDQVRFLPGFFRDTLPTAPIKSLAILRVDADLYQSTADVLEHLYPKLAVGGFAIFDDYQNLPDCRLAIDEYRAAHGVTDPVRLIDSRAAFWRKSA